MRKIYFIVDTTTESKIMALCSHAFQIDCAVFASLLHAMKPQHLQDTMPMLRVWCAVSPLPPIILRLTSLSLSQEYCKSHVSTTTLGKQLEKLLKTGTDDVKAAVGVARLAYVLGSHKGVIAALGPVIKVSKS